MDRTLRKYLPLGLLLLILLVCNLAFPDSTGWSRVFWAAFGYGGLFFVYWLAKLSLDDAGLNQKNITSGLIYAAWIILLVFVSLVVAYAISRSSFRDSRYHHAVSTAVYSSLVILPVKTVFFEELAFRGILLGYLLKLKFSKWNAVLISSVVFGFWHVSTAAVLRDGSFSSQSYVHIILSVIGTVFATFLAGIIFCEIRLRSKSLAAPIAVHWFINGAATVLAAISWS